MAYSPALKAPHQPDPTIRLRQKPCIWEGRLEWPSARLRTWSVVRPPSCRAETCRKMQNSRMRPAGNKYGTHSWICVVLEFAHPAAFLARVVLSMTGQLLSHFADNRFEHWACNPWTLLSHFFNPSSLPFRAFSLTPSESNQLGQIRLADSIDVHVGELRQFTNLGRDLGSEPFGLRHVVDQLQQRAYLQTIKPTGKQTSMWWTSLSEKMVGRVMVVPVFSERKARNSLFSSSAFLYSGEEMACLKSSSARGQGANTFPI